MQVLEPLVAPPVIIVTNNNNRRTGRRNNNQAARPSSTPSVVFEGSDPLLKGYVYDVPNGKNNNQFIKTTKQVMITMAPSMGSYAAEFSTAFETLTLAMPAAVGALANGADQGAFHIWKEERREVADRTLAYNAWLAKLFLKVLDRVPKL
jgi:hypothetical protein